MIESKLTKPKLIESKLTIQSSRKLGMVQLTSVGKAKLYERGLYALQNLKLVVNYACMHWRC